MQLIYQIQIYNKMGYEIVRSEARVYANIFFYYNKIIDPELDKCAVKCSEKFIVVQRAVLRKIFTFFLFLSFRSTLARVL